VIDKNRLEIENDVRSMHCSTREDHDGLSVIDLTSRNRPTMKCSIRVDDHATGSNHKVIDWEVEADGQEEADHEKVVGWNVDAMTEEDLEAAEKLWRELAKERAYLSAECTSDEVEHKAGWCQEAMSSVLIATAKHIRICGRSKRWWNDDIKERRKAFGRENRRPNSGEAAKRKAKLQKSIRLSKSKMWSEYLLNLRGAEVWREAR